MTLFQALLLAILQGASELFPVSSLGHAVVIPALLHWSNAARVSDPNGPFLPFLVMLHLGTAAALVVFYWNTWARIIRAFFEQFTVKGGITKDARLANLLIVGTIPTGILGAVLEKRLRGLFSSPRDAAIFLIANGLLMIGGELLRRRSAKGERPTEGNAPQARTTIAQLGWAQALWIGLTQALALLPGISRSGATITGGLLTGLSGEDAANFSFLLATPIILAAGLLEAPKLRHAQVHMAHIGLYSIIGLVVSGITAYLSVKFLTRYFETKRLDPFGYYCILLGAVTLISLGIGR